VQKVKRLERKGRKEKRRVKLKVKPRNDEFC
jgi:hypothetical protein